VADRIVVMNKGEIEQVGTALDIYREPATPFVADFVGKVNVLHANRVNGRLQLGKLSLPGFGADNGPVKAYVRPEDVLAQPLAAGDAHVIDSKIEKIDFLGAYCHVLVSADALGSDQLTVLLSLNFLTDQALRVGSMLPLKLLPERIKVF